ncbi:YcnI family protein [Streptomyces sp. NPDC090023]|uniref:YcnI family protein n=1 Tax=unclassified Streptomyces TaxID=2593676 RepID=UPI003804756E
MSRVHTTLRRVGALTVLTAAGLVAAAGVASAHVTVHPESYAKGATDGVLTFRVPNEQDDASTTKVQVFLPSGHPVLGVLVSPHDGWSAKVTNTKLRTPVKTDDGTITDAVSEVTWTGGRIEPGRFEDFDIAFGQLPDGTDRLTFKTLQTYSDGKTVRWIEEPAQGEEEPENPAPVLTLTAEDGQNSRNDASDAPVAAKKGTLSSAEGTDSRARTLGTTGLIVGVLGLAAGACAIVRSRSRGTGSE